MELHHVLSMLLLFVAIALALPGADNANISPVPRALINQLENWCDFSCFDDCSKGCALDVRCISPCIGKCCEFNKAQDTVAADDVAKPDVSITPRDDLHESDACNFLCYADCVLHCGSYREPRCRTHCENKCCWGRSVPKPIAEEITAPDVPAAAPEPRDVQPLEDRCMVICYIECIRACGDPDDPACRKQCTGYCCFDSPAADAPAEVAGTDAPAIESRETEDTVSTPDSGDDPLDSHVLCSVKCYRGCLGGCGGSRNKKCRKHCAKKCHCAIRSAKDLDIEARDDQEIPPVASCSTGCYLGCLPECGGIHNQTCIAICSKECNCGGSQELDTRDELKHKPLPSPGRHECNECNVYWDQCVNTCGPMNTKCRRSCWKDVCEKGPEKCHIGAECDGPNHHCATPIKPSILPRFG